MDRKKALILGGGGAAGIAALAAAAWALAPGPRGLAELDFNRDGRIVRAELQQGARQRFAALDADRDGRLAGEELPRRGRHGHGRRERFDPDAPRPQAAVSPTGGIRADADNDGALDLREFYADLSARALRADTNRDGTITAEELAAHRPGRGHGSRRHGH